MSVMKTYTASRLSETNRLFPIQVRIDVNGVSTTKMVGIGLSKETHTVSFGNIACVRVRTPLVGFSTLEIETKGGKVVRAHGFTEADMKEMHSIINRNVRIESKSAWEDREG